jgi:hypothetical protein
MVEQVDMKRTSSAPCVIAALKTRELDRRSGAAEPASRPPRPGGDATLVAC